MPIAPVSADELLDPNAFQREFILIAGKDGVGKTSAILSLARFVEMMDADRRFFIIDTENKVIPTLRGFGADAPTNLTLYRATNMNEVLEAFGQVMEQHRPGDWFAGESMSRIWERSQDLGYKAITNQAKAEYMEKRRQVEKGQKVPPVTPRPDDLWSIIKGAHDGEFLEPIAACDTLNVVLSTTVAKPKEIPGRQGSADRKDLRAEFGIDLNLDGAPRLPYYVQTLLLLERLQGRVSCRVLRDNCSALDDAAIEFALESRKSFALDWWQACRVPQSA